MSTFVFTLKLDETSANVVAKFPQVALRPRESVRFFRQLVHNIESRAIRAVVDSSYSSTDPVAASQTVTCSTVNADETFVIGGVTFTAKASPSGEAQFDQSGTDSATATSLAAKINAHSTIGNVVSAAAEAGVVTVTCKVKGEIGNFIELAETGSGMTLGAAALAGGTGGGTSTPVSVACGIS